jgi:hypothetical protein
VPIAEDPLAKYHQSEWGRIPNATLPAGENNLAAYHQSEWGRTSSTVLPIAKNETNADQDIGLMEFSTNVTEVGVQRHDREYGLAAFSTIPPEVKEADAPRASNEAGLARYHESEWGFAPNKANADWDIGLMEFFAAPNETSRQHIGADTPEALPNIDPADRKFFNPGYGVRPGVSEEAEVLATIDPADRKFFSPGYGAQTTSANRSEVILPAIENKMGEWGAIWFLLK